MGNSKIEVQEYALHKIDVNENKIKAVALDGTVDDFKNYAEHVLNELLHSERAKQFAFQNHKELVASCLLEVVKGADWEGNTEAIASKLLEVEKDTQTRVDKLGVQVRKGGLLQIKIKEGGRVKIALIKIDDGEFLDETELRLKTGLPNSKTRLQKAALVTFGDKGLVEDLIVSDSKPKISEYWYLYFLVANQLTDSETNTKNAFSAVDKLLNKEVRKVSPVDYWYLRNEVVSHFRNEDSMAYDELVEKIKKHKPESPDFEKKFDSFVEKFSKLPTVSGKGFDTQFDIESSVIKARIVKKVFLDANFELRINGEVKDFKNKIGTGKDEKGKYIKIYSDNGYKEFSPSTNQ